jgi:uncharacterized membrane protein
VWLPNLAVWTLVSLALVLLLEMLPGRPSVFLVALGNALITVAVVVML